MSRFILLFGVAQGLSSPDLAKKFYLVITQNYQFPKNVLGSQFRSVVYLSFDGNYAILRSQMFLYFSLII